MIYQVIVPESVYLELKETSFYYESKQKKLGLKIYIKLGNSDGAIKRSAITISKKA